MTVECTRCGEKLELPDEMCENGVRFECSRCGAKFSFYNGQVYEWKRPPEEGRPAKEDAPDGSGDRAEHVRPRGAGARRRVCPEVIDLSSVFSRRRLLFAAAVVAGVVALECCERGCDKGGGSDDYRRLARLEKRYGTNSVEFIEARLEMIRSITLPLNEGLVKQHRAFELRMEDVGLAVLGGRYSGDRLASLSLMNADGLTGTISAGLSGNSISFPAWLSAGDAKAIWNHYSNRVLVEAGEALADTERLIRELEAQLQELKEERQARGGTNAKK